MLKLCVEPESIRINIDFVWMVPLTFIVVDDDLQRKASKEIFANVQPCIVFLVHWFLKIVGQFH